MNRIVNAPVLNATIWNPMSDITSSPVAKIRRREQKDVSQSPMEAERVAVMAKISLCQVRHHAEQPRQHAFERRCDYTGAAPSPG